jgi:succinate-acetate transporter protein
VSLLFGWLFYVIFAKLTPFGIDLDDVNKSPIAVGIFLFGYEVFLGLIIYGSLMIPLG